MRKLEKLLFVSCLLLVLVHAVASFFPQQRLWGLNLLHYVPAVARWLLVAFALLALVPPVNRFMADLLGGLFVLAESGSKKTSRYFQYALLGSSSFLLFWSFKIKTYLLGDGNLRVAEIFDGRSFAATEPLDFYLHAQISRLMKVHPFTIYAVLSCLAGVLFVFLILLLSKLTLKDREGRLLVFLVLATMGANQLFFGYVESYTLMYAALGGFILFSLYYLKGRCGFFWPSLIFILAVGLHFSAIFLLPGALYVRLAKKAQPGAQNKILPWGNIVPAVVLLVIIAGSVLALREYSPQQADLGSFFVYPLGVGEDHHSLFSASHLLDFLNHQLLVSPLGIPIWLVLGVFFWKKINFKNSELVFLVLISVCSLAFGLAVDPKLGYPRDWDLFAFTGLGYTVLAVYLLLDILKESGVKRIRYVTLALVSTSLISTVPWIYVNASEQKALERIGHILQLDGKRSALGHEALAYHYRNRRLKDKEIEEWKKAVALVEKPRYIKNLGVTYIEVGKYQEASWQLEKVLSQNPNDHLTHSDLGKTYVALGRYEDAKREFQKAIELQPENPIYYENLGFLFLNLKSYPKSKEVFQKALRIDSTYSPNYRNLGFAHAYLGENQEALGYLELYLKHEPQARDRDYVRGLIRRLRIEKEVRP